ncbi:MAG: PIN domain-containing protein [Actinomycetes bacterium]
MSILLDAGPALNYIAVGAQHLLLDLAAARGLQLAAPEKVRQEVDRKAGQGRFAGTGAQGTWRKLLAASRVIVLDDDLSDPTFIQAVSRVAGQPASDRMRDNRDLGEILVIAHALVLVQRGQAIYVLIDDGDGRRRALREQNWLVSRAAPGSLSLWSTPQVLRQTAPERWETLYARMRQFDDGLPPLRSIQDPHQG